MASINKVILIGNLGRDPEIRYTADGNTAICSSSGGSSEFITLVSLWKKKNTGF